MKSFWPTSDFAAQGASGDLACVALAGGLSTCADEGADRRPWHACFPGSANGVNHVALGLGPLRHRCSEQGYCTGVEFVFGIGFVGLEARSQLVGVLQDLVNSSREHPDLPCSSPPMEQGHDCQAILTLWRAIPAAPAQLSGAT